jgi:hypothetical protein
MDNLDRMYRHLVRTIRAKFPQYLTQPFDVAALQQTVLPYRLHRRELGLETNEDYEITLTELLSGARDYLIVDEQMRDALKAELEAVNPDPSAFKQFAPAMVALSPNALRSLEAGPDDPSTPLRPVAVPEARADAEKIREAQPVEPRAKSAAATAGGSVTAARPRASAEPPAGPPRSTPTLSPSGARAITPQPEERCRSCNEVLPAGRPITFCPHCGQNVTTLYCPACGSELEVGWKFCPVCGRPADAH